MLLMQGLSFDWQSSPIRDGHASTAEQSVSCKPVFPFCRACTVPNSRAATSSVVNDCTTSAFRSSVSFLIVASHSDGCGMKHRGCPIRQHRGHVNIRGVRRRYKETYDRAIL